LSPSGKVVFKLYTRDEIDALLKKEGAYEKKEEDV
jgi:hypothetical protein